MTERYGHVTLSVVYMPCMYTTLSYKCMVDPMIDPNLLASFAIGIRVRDREQSVDHTIIVELPWWVPKATVRSSNKRQKMIEDAGRAVCAS